MFGSFGVCLGCLGSVLAVWGVLGGVWVIPDRQYPRCARVQEALHRAVGGRRGAPGRVVVQEPAPEEVAECRVALRVHLHRKLLLGRQEGRSVSMRRLSLNTPNQAIGLSIVKGSHLPRKQPEQKPGRRDGSATPHAQAARRRACPRPRRGQRPSGS